MNVLCVLCVVFISERVRGAKYMKCCCVVVCSRTSKLCPAKQRLQEYLKGTNRREMVCNLFHYFPTQFIVAVTVTVVTSTVWQAALVVVVAYR